MLDLSSPTVLLVCTALVVFAIRKLSPKLDGRVPVLLVAALVGGLLAAVQSQMPAITAWLATHPAIGAGAKGAVAGFLAFGGANGLQWLTAQLPAVLVDGDKP